MECKDGSRNILTATWYVCVESEPTTMKTPTTTQNMYAITHQAKFGNAPFRRAAIREATKVMSHASYWIQSLALHLYLRLCPEVGEYVRMQSRPSLARMDRQQYVLHALQYAYPLIAIAFVLPILNPRMPPRLPELASKLPFILRSDGDSRLP